MEAILIVLTIISIALTLLGLHYENGMLLGIGLAILIILAIYPHILKGVIK